MLRSAGLQLRRGFATVYRMTITDDGSTIVAHHPEAKVPYEDSLPLPPEQVVQDDSPLKIGLAGARARDKLSRACDINDRLQLAKMSMTTHHRWWPRPRDKKAKKGPMDRPYL